LRPVTLWNKSVDLYSIKLIKIGCYVWKWWLTENWKDDLRVRDVNSKYSFVYQQSIGKKNIEDD
jgi:hypothetical protein